MRISVQTGSECSRLRANRFAKLLVLACLSLLLASCGGGGGGGVVDANCKRGLIAGFSAEIADAKIPSVFEQEGQGGSDGDGSVGNGEGVGIGGDDGQYTNVEVSVELANGRIFGPWPVDSTKGMVTYVHCGDVLPAKITFVGKAADAVYYDEGLKRDVSFTGKTRVGLMTDYEKNVGITPLTEALYERAMEIGRQRGLTEGWKDLTVIAQAHRELLAIVNDQLPSIYRLTDLTRLPVMLNASNDRVNSGTLPANQNGVHGADIAALSLLGATTLPGSTNPGLDVAQTLISDLLDGELDLTDASGRSLIRRGHVPYTYDTLWSSLTVGAGETAVRNGRDELATNTVPIGHVRSRAGPNSSNAVTETLYVLGSGGVVIANLNPSVGGGRNTQPAGDLQYSQLYRFGLEPVVAMRRDGRGLLVFPTSWDGSFSFDVSAPTGSVRMVEMFDAGFPVIRMSDGSLFRLQGSTLVSEPAPVGTLSYSCRNEFDGALANGTDPVLGPPDRRVCYGLNVDNELRVWRSGSATAGRLIFRNKIKQVHSNEQITLALQSDGSLFQLDNDHSVQFRNANGDLVDQLTGVESRELLTAGASALQITAPPICWVRAPFVIGCDGTAYQLEYREYLDVQGRFQGAGPITGLKQLPIPAPVWRPLLNRQITVGDVKLGTDSVFVGTDGLVYDLDGKVVDLPLSGAPQQRTDQPPLAPAVSAVAVDDVLDRNEAQNPLVVNGFAQPGSTVTVTLGVRERQTTTNGDGRWQVTYPTNELPANDGATTLNVVAANSFGASAPSIRTVNVLRSLPTTPTINTIEGDNTVTAAEAADGVTVTGSGLAGSTIQVAWAGQAKTTRVESNSNWSVTFVAGEVPAPADTQVSATASNINGASDTAMQAVRILPAPPQTPRISTIAGDNVVSPDEANTGVTIGGKGSPGSNVTVNWVGVSKSATIDGSSNWSVFYSANEIPSPGNTTVTAVATNRAGSSNTASQAVQVEIPPIPVPPSPTINTVAGDNRVSRSEAAAGVTISGRAVSGVTVRIDWAGIGKTIVANNDGNWSVFYSANQIPPIGRTTVSAQSENVSGASQPATLEVQVEPLLAPAAPVILGVEGRNFITASQVPDGVTISGTAMPGSTVTVEWGAPRNLLITRKTVSDSASKWSIFYADKEIRNPGLIDSSTSVSATASNAAGTSETTQFTLKVLPPEVPTIDLPSDGSNQISYEGGPLRLSGTAQSNLVVSIDWMDDWGNSAYFISRYDGIRPLSGGQWSYIVENPPSSGRITLSISACHLFACSENEYEIVLGEVSSAGG